ncbi:MAG TPA: diadenylate cyclase CdaA [Bryobacteraceae bacterium]|nr:diadenylate cyclase CdaA [Bryobacteraceae bacterium]
MLFLSSPLISSIPKLTPTAIIDILAVAFLIYQFIMIIRGRRAAHILTGIWILVMVYLVAVWARLELLRSILAALAPYTAFGLIVMFQSELRRLLARLGRSQFLGLGSRLERREVIDEILLALGQMSQRRVGALIVIERNMGLRTFIESGVQIDAFVSRDLLCSIFEPGGALHDGAVIIQGDRIAAAACFLPLAMNPVRLGGLGTRHRAAIGITEEADCISLVVSEETGRISIAAFGEIEVDVSVRRVEERLAQHKDAKPKPQLAAAGTTTSGTVAHEARVDDSPEPKWKQAKRR